MKPVGSKSFPRCDVNLSLVWGVHDNVSPLRVPNHVWQKYLQDKPGQNRYWVVPAADHYLQCDAPAELAQIIRLTAKVTTSRAAADTWEPTRRRRADRPEQASGLMSVRCHDLDEGSANADQWHR